MALKTQEQIEDLKAQWKHDPVWDIEETEGFEDYKAELLAYREQVEADDRKQNATHTNARATLVCEQTGVTEAVIVLSLRTWSEIDQMASLGDKTGDRLKVETALVHATLLQAAQLKRIADALENMEANASTAGIWSSK